MSMQTFSRRSWCLIWGWVFFFIDLCHTLPQGNCRLSYNIFQLLNNRSLVFTNTSFLLRADPTDLSSLEPLGLCQCAVIEPIHFVIPGWDFAPTANPVATVLLTINNATNQTSSSVLPNKLVLGTDKGDGNVVASLTLTVTTAIFPIKTFVFTTVMYVLIPNGNIYVALKSNVLIVHLPILINIQITTSMSSLKLKP